MGDLDDDTKNSGGKYSEEDKMIMEIFGEGMCHIIPSFWRTVIFLKKQKRNFQIVFRTFGEDIPNIVYEFNQFCDGRHPSFNGVEGLPLIKFDGTNGTKDMRIRENS